MTEESRRDTIEKNAKGSSFALWDDFNIHKLNNDYGHILDNNTPERQWELTMHGGLEVPGQNIVINHDYDVKGLVKWNNFQMEKTLRPAKREKCWMPGTELKFVCPSEDQGWCSVKLPGTRLSLSHYIYLEDFPCRNLVVGITRTKCKWDGNSFNQQVENNCLTEGLKMAMNVLAYRCQKANTKYGYIQNEIHMVVVRFTPGMGGEFSAEYMIIPWSRTGHGALTTGLALWWLCMIAMGEVV